jgi:hypothetical protein
MKKNFYTVVLALMLTPVIAFGDPIDISKAVFEFDLTGVIANYTAPPATGSLHWTGGGKFMIYSTDPLSPVNTYYPTVDVTFSNGIDQSSDGNAKALFSGMSFSVDIYSNRARNVYLGTVGGTLYNSNCKYLEQEIDTTPLGGSVLDGGAVIKLTSFDIPGYQWVEDYGAPAGMTSTTNLAAGNNIADYLSNWSSGNTTITVLADESGIPEPATIGLLTLGGLLLRRKK